MANKLFSTIISELGYGSYKCNEEGCIYKISEHGFSINFYNNFIKIKINDTCKIEYGQSFNFSYTNPTEELVEINFKNTSIGTLKKENADIFKEIIEKINSSFSENKDCTPSFEIQSFCNEYGIKHSDKYEWSLYKMYYNHNNKFLTLIEDNIILPNSRIIMILEENTGKLTGNLSGTIKKNVSLSNLSLSGLGKTAFNIAKAGGKKIINEKKNNFLGKENLIILTSENIIVCFEDSINQIDFDEFNDMFIQKDDESFADIVDIYSEETNEKVLDNVDKNLFKEFKRKIRQIKTAPEIIKEDFSQENEVTSDQDKLEQELEKFKRQLDKGLISQKDFDKQKKILLNEYNRNKNLQKTTSKEINTISTFHSDEIQKGSSDKSRLLMLVMFFIPITSIPSIYCFYAGRIFYAIFKCACLIIGMTYMFNSNGSDSRGLVCLGAWAVLHALDFFMILFGNFKDGDGRKISDWT